MKMREYCHCENCGDEKYGDEYLYDLGYLGEGMVCEECFIEYVKNHKLLPEDILDEDGWSGKLLAKHLDIEYTTVESYLENEYYLMLEEKEEARRDMYL